MPLTPEQKAYQVEYRKKHRATLSAYNRDYQRRWYLKNRAKRLAQTKNYQLHHPEVGRTASRNWARRNPEQHRANARKWRALNIDRRRAYEKAYRQKNRELLLRKLKAYAKKNPHVPVATSARRRALKRQSQIDTQGIRAWMKEVRSKPFARCHWCGTKVRGRNIHFDHVVALTKGGTHTIGNLCASCRECNLSKSNRLISEWLCGGQSFLSL